MKTFVHAIGVVLLASALAASLSVVSQGTAHADRDLVTRVDFIAWSGVNPDTYCVRIRDAQAGNKLEVRQIGNPVAMASVPVTPDTEQAVFRGPQFAPWSFIVAGKAGTTAPNGWKVFGQFERSAALFRVGVTNGRSSLEVGRMQPRPDAVSGGYAKATLRTAYWSPDSTRVVVIVNHRTSGAWPLDLDEPQGFKIGK
jgi:hypothetical protein